MNPMDTKIQAPEWPVGLRMLAWLLTTVVSLPSPALAGSDLRASPDGPCPLCREDLEVPVVRLTAAHLDSLAAGHAAFNERQLARIDSLLHDGTWGPPDDSQARRCAHLLAQLSLVNAYRDLVHWAAADDRVYEADGTALAEVYGRYADVSLFLGPHRAGLRIGRGRACVRYALEESGEGESWHGGRRLRWSVRDAKVEGRKRRVLDVTLPTGQDGEVRFLFSSHHTMAISHERSSGPPAPFEWFLVHDIEGVWIRKWGMHRPTAYMLWMSTPSASGVTSARPSFAPIALAASPPPGASALSLPGTPLLGLRVYAPGLRLRLPFLPDIPVEDLRTVDIIMPVLGLDYLRRGDHPPWLELDRNLGFRDWKGQGPIPPEIRRRFPDG